MIDADWGNLLGLSFPELFETMILTTTLTIANVMKMRKPKHRLQYNPMIFV
jgi:hypothetical protein